ncbi:MAG: hypothetical protein QMD11_01815 [Smithella sp.]|nr:hypothetical protein [Smithella sp.]
MGVMTSKISFHQYLTIGIFIILFLGAGFFGAIQTAQADPPKRSREQTVKRSPAPQQKTSADSRYRPNRSYPSRGQAVRSLPRDHRVVIHGQSRYYAAHGSWYRPYRGRYVVVAPPIGLFVSFLPFAYTTIWFRGMPYYYANDTYYTGTGGGYVVVEPPPADGRETPPFEADRDDVDDNRMFVYPRHNQSEEQQAFDRYECHQWAADETGYDPTALSPEVPTHQIRLKRSDYQRAMSACLDSRGYTAR